MQPNEAGVEIAIPQFVTGFRLRHSITNL
jgi:hypothetical protein